MTLSIKGFKAGQPIAIELSSGERWERFKIKTISAYAIDSASLFTDGAVNNFGAEDFFFHEGDIVINIRINDFYRDHINFFLQIHYYGIRDYSLLFPDVVATDPVRAKRMGMLYEEAEKCFQNAAWLSFAIMSGAVFEHILYFKLNGAENNLSSLINKAEGLGIISSSDAELMRTVKNLRNAIHCNKLELDYISKITAMDIKKLIDKVMMT